MCGFFVKSNVFEHLDHFFPMHCHSSGEWKESAIWPQATPPRDLCSTIRRMRSVLEFKLVFRNKSPRAVVSDSGYGSIRNIRSEPIRSDLFPSENECTICGASPSAQFFDRADSSQARATQSQQLCGQSVQL